MSSFSCSRGVKRMAQSVLLNYPRSFPPNQNKAGLRWKGRRGGLRHRGDKTFIATKPPPRRSDAPMRRGVQRRDVIDDMTPAHDGEAGVSVLPSEGPPPSLHHQMLFDLLRAQLRRLARRH